MNANDRSGAAATSEFVLARMFDAPRDVVWRAFTESERLNEWWGPTGFAMLACKVDLRPGGIFHYGMRAPTGETMWGKWVYREIVEPERIVFVVSFSDEKAGITRHPLSESWPLELLSSTTFEERDGRTLVTDRAVPINATEEERGTFVENLEGMRLGTDGSWDQLAAYLAKL
ncbi:MAG: SRPBCC domain-containing protein [Parvibaculum sp.]|uniref:SRPBCC domain-containing protein n=1 Tax=Parvibaculum sp. TaxID=2024848 RepID=UPI003C774308